MSRKITSLQGQTKPKFIKALLKKINFFPFYVFCLTLYTILTYLVANLSQVNLNVANRLLVLFSVGTLALLLLTRLFGRDFSRAGAYIFLILLLFFTYEPVRIVLWKISHALANDAFLFPLTMLLLIGSILLIARQSADKIRGWTPYLNIFGLILLAFPLGRIGIYQRKMAKYQEGLLAQLQQEAPIPPSTSLKFLPDVYFIVLDGYARHDVLEQQVGLDNSEFLDALRQRGFYVADCSMSNYAQTELSLTSTLDMTYLDEIIEQLPEVGEEYFSSFIKHSQVRQFFELLGYQTVNYYNGYYWMHWDDATYFLGDPRVSQNIDRMIPFEELFLKTTLFRFLSDTYQAIIPPSQSSETLSEDEANRAIVLFTLENLPETTFLRSPKFVYVHLMLPHPPYIFGPNGEKQNITATDLASRLEGYRDQVLFANNRTLPIIDNILSESGGNVIILLEGDHGLIDYQEDWMRMANLMAYYFPDQDYSKLYSSITPVNSFRIVLSQYFGQDYPLLEDVSYYSAKSSDRPFEVIPNTCNR
ncbi:MAG: hypothetical protein AB1531_12340 [Chloroflexota bacterium]